MFINRTDFNLKKSKREEKRKREQNKLNKNKEFKVINDLPKKFTGF